MDIVILRLPVAGDSEVCHQKDTDIQYLSLRHLEQGQNLPPGVHIGNSQDCLPGTSGTPLLTTWDRTEDKE